MRRRVPSCAVIVRLCAVEPEIPGVLNCQIDVLDGPPRNIQQVSIALRGSVGASRHRSQSEEERIAGAGDVKQSRRPGKLRAVMVFDVRLGGVQMVINLRRTSGIKGRQKGRVFADKAAAEGEYVVLKLEISFDHIGSRRQNPCSRP